MIQEYAVPLAVHMLEDFHMVIWVYHIAQSTFYKESESVELDKAIDNYVNRNMLEMIMEQILYLNDDKIIAENDQSLKL
jgi:hypothetical protein